ncbi:MAG: ABC transporter permease [Acidobacteriota bacterium]|jgi:putative ABC transport system permease protein|nr:ABC transporter permease [Acidobacteriota bacterium]
MVDYRENLKMALDTLLSHKFRSFLTILGIVVGVVVVIVIASALTGLRGSIVDMLEGAGANNIYASHLPIVQTGRLSREERMRKPLKITDAAAIREQCPAVQDVALALSSNMRNFQIQYQGNRLRSSQFYGASANYGAVGNVDIENGRFFSDSEERRRMPVTVLGPDAAEAMFGEAMDPVGKQILIGGRPFTVVGVAAKSKTSFLTSGADNFVMIPFGTLRRMTPDNENIELAIQAKSGMRDQALGEIESLLRRLRGVGYNEENNFDLTTADKIMEQLDSITAMLGIAMISISGIGLLVGGIGVMNIMLVSVTERTREIGVRKAVGATKNDIVLQFLFEAMTLSGMGGLFGVIIAAFLSWMIVLLIPELPAAIPLWAVVTGLGVSIAIGLIFGVWPARKAAMLDPIEALRYE